MSILRMTAVNGTGGGGGVSSVVAGTNVTVDNTDPANPIVSATGIAPGAGGSDTEVQANNAGVLDGDPALKFNFTTKALTYNRTVYVTTGGSDANAGTEAAPMATLQAAAARLGGYGEIIVGAGDYFNQALDVTTCPDIKIRGYLQYYGPARFFYGEKITSGWTSLGGGVYSKVISTVIPADITSGVEAYSWVFEQNTPEAATIITQANAHPLQKERTHRLPHARLMQVTSLGAVTAGKFYYNAGTSTLYIQRYNSADPTGSEIFVPAFNATGASSGLIYGGTNLNKLEVEDIHVYYANQGIFCGNTNHAILRNVLTYGCYYAGAFFRFTDYSEEWNCEYAASGQDGADYISAYTPANVSNHQKHFSFNCWGHDCGDQNFSWHGQTTLYMYGGLSENARNGGILGGGGNFMAYNVTSRNNDRAGFLTGIGEPNNGIVGTISIAAAGTGYTAGDFLTLTGGNNNCTLYVNSVGGGGVITAIQVFPLANGTGYSVASALATTGGTGSGCTINVLTLAQGEAYPSMELDNCISINDEVAFYSGNNTCRTIVRGGSVVNPTTASFGIASGCILDNYGCMVPNTKIKTGSGTLNHNNQGLYGDIFFSNTGSNGVQYFGKNGVDGGFNALDTYFIARTATPDTNIPVFTNSFYLDAGSTQVSRFESYAASYHSFKMGSADWNYYANGDFYSPGRIDMGGGYSFAGKFTLTANSLGVTQADSSGSYLRNTTAASSGNQQISPASIWEGQGWKTNATAASQSVKFRSYTLPVQGAANPSALWKLQSSINGGAYADVMNVSSAGLISTATWGGTTVTAGFGGTGQSSYTQGDLLYASSSNALAKLNKSTGATRFLSNKGTSNNPSWSQIDLSTDITGLLPVANGGYWQAIGDNIYNANVRNVYIGTETCIGLNEGSCNSYTSVGCTANYTTEDCHDYDVTDQATCETGHSGCSWDGVDTCNGTWQLFANCTGDYRADDGTDAFLQVHDHTVCSGTATACASLAGSEAGCNAQDGCSYQANSCTGQPDQSTCEAQPAGCTWGGHACGGNNAVPNTCPDQMDEESCNGTAGCSWNIDTCDGDNSVGNTCPDYNENEAACGAAGCTYVADSCMGDNHACNGTASACATYGDETSCEDQAGCSWTITPSLSAGGDIYMHDGADFIIQTTTGTKFGTGTSQKIGFWNAAPIAQPTTGISAATFTANSGTAVNDASTFDGYTIGKVVKALRNAGLLA